jgi:hypothetical protein
MTTGTVQKGPLMRLGLMVLVLLLGLCTVFASVVTVAEDWQEYVQARWPEVTARVDECGLEPTSSGRREKFYIRCRLSYAVDAAIPDEDRDHTPSRRWLRLLCDVMVRPLSQRSLA